jgi:hypothetical protein
VPLETADSKLYIPAELILPTQTANMDRRRRRNGNQSFSGLTKPALTIISINIEGFSNVKGELLQDLCRSQDCDVLCVQETHRDENDSRPHIPGMKRIVERPHPKYGSAVYVKPETDVLTTNISSENDMEILTIELHECKVTSVYKPPASPFAFNALDCSRETKKVIVIGDFNSRSTHWGYEDCNADGEAVVAWAENNGMSLIHDHKLPSSFNSGRWRKGYNPDIVFASDAIRKQCAKGIGKPIPRTQHRPIICRVTAPIKPVKIPFRRRFNFRKANWECFSAELDSAVSGLESSPENYDDFVDAVKSCSRKHIPRGCRDEYIAGLNPETATMLEEYCKMYEEAPFAESTVAAGDALVDRVAEERRDRWRTMVEGLDMVHSSNKAWRTIKTLSGEGKANEVHINITPDQIAHQILLNGKSTGKKPRGTLARRRDEETLAFSGPIVISELQLAIEQMKPHKAAGPDDIRPEIIKHFGLRTLEWLLQLFNRCLTCCRIPRLWRRSKIIAVLKPGKEPTSAKNFRPIALLCHTYKVMERIIANRISGHVDAALIEEQAGFRPGKSSTGQILNLIQEIEDGYEEKQVTGVVFVDLSAAYDTINHRLLISKFYDMTKDYRLTMFLRSMLENRRYCVQLQNRTSRWRTQRNGLPQGSVLAPMLFNVYTNDQPRDTETRSYIYADDLALLARDMSFEVVEDKLCRSLETLGTYYKNNWLKPNPCKTQTCAFHLRNREASRTLNVNWNGTNLQHTASPKYLGVTLDRTLTYRSHCENVKQKIAARNSILRKLVNSQWGASPTILRTSAIALAFSAGEYACPVWWKSTHAKRVDCALNDSCRVVTGCLKPTPVGRLYALAGMAPPGIRREVAAGVERAKQMGDTRHPLYGHQPPARRLASRNSFLNTTRSMEMAAEQQRLYLWGQVAERDWIVPDEMLPSGGRLPWALWITLNRLRSGVGRCRANLVRWGMLPSGEENCDCGEKQTMDHVLSCPLLDSGPVAMRDLIIANDKAIQAASHWTGIL